MKPEVPRDEGRRARPEQGPGRLRYIFPCIPSLAVKRKGSCVFMLLYKNIKECKGSIEVSLPCRQAPRRLAAGVCAGCVKHKGFVGTQL